VKKDEGIQIKIKRDKREMCQQKECVLVFFDEGGRNIQDKKKHDQYGEGEWRKNSRRLRRRPGRQTRTIPQ
jgi:hypothetical protein